MKGPIKTPVRAVRGQFTIRGSRYAQIVESDDGLIATVQHGHLAAQQIALALNFHDKLVQVLRESISCSENEDCSLCAPNRALLTEIEAAS